MHKHTQENLLYTSYTYLCILVRDSWVSAQNLFSILTFITLFLWIWIVNLNVNNFSRKLSKINLYVSKADQLLVNKIFCCWDKKMLTSSLLIKKHFLSIFCVSCWRFDNIPMPSFCFFNIFCCRYGSRSLKLSQQFLRPRQQEIDAI